ncbi:hypothetical protein EDD29_0393 [Actinocorallia herbida]|uniref:Uncharacterized protein n=1 Tax=Actinocorallia herbida TaxID=58109 RepID=A0A3N1CQA2_9ACTN|nr:hypothetical protein EDD29_0393 [Actinocorallia herbida]
MQSNHDGKKPGLPEIVEILAVSVCFTYISGGEAVGAVGLLIAYATLRWGRS